MSPALRLAGVRVRLGAHEVLREVDLEVRPGEMVGVLGANGSGKTTLMRAALGLVALKAGTAELGGRPVRGLSEPARAACVGYLPQERRLGWNMTAERVASLGAALATPAQARQRAAHALRRVGLSHLAGRGALEMSGGERARVLLARLLVTEAPLLLADEPIAGLDPDAQLMALQLFREEAERGAGVLLTLHDLPLAARACDRLVVLSAGRVVADAAAATALSPQVLREAFGLEGRLTVTPEGAMLSARRREVS